MPGRYMYFFKLASNVSRSLERMLIQDNHLFHMQLEPEFDLPEDNARQDDDEDYYPPNLKNPKKNAAAKKYSCDQCRFVTVSTAYLNRHMEAAHGALLSCQECADFTTHSSKDMKQHVAATHTNNYSPPSELKGTHMSYFLQYPYFFLF